MNKLSKIGLSALCGSLAAISSASAGDLTVTGGANATYTSEDNATVGNPLGMASAVTFKGSGELDNGTTFALTLDSTDQEAYSSGQIVMTTPSMGTFAFDQGAGGRGIDRLDDKMPTAWEETDGTGIGAGLQTVSGIGGSTAIEWAAPGDMMPDGVSVYLGYTPKSGQSGINDKASGGTGVENKGSGWDLVVEHSGLMDGLNAFAGYSTVEQYVDNTNDGDQTEYALGATYAVGSVTVGYQYTRSNRQPGSSTGGEVEYYENNAYGVSFNVNDDLSLSYGVHTSDVSKSGAADVELEATSLQIAYSMGGATIKVAETSIDNASYQTGAAFDKDGTSMMLSLAF